MQILEKKQKKIIGIDARFYGPHGKGLGRYTQEIVDRVLKLDHENRYVIFLSKENYDSFATENRNAKKVLVEARWYSFTEQFAMPLAILREKIDLMHFPHFNVPVLCPAKFVVTIHDLILTKFPTARATTLGPLSYLVKNFGYRLVIWLAVKRSKKIIAVSEFTKNDIIKNFSTDSSKIAVTYEGVAVLGGRQTAGENDDDKKTLLGYNIHSKYLLYVGNAYPHKNLEGMIDVFFKVREKISDLDLVLVGKEDYFYKRVKEYADSSGMTEERHPAVLFPGYVPDKELGTLYRHAEAYVFSSLYEGFGLPPLEAMSYGCPVVSSDRASMPEILGNAALYMDPKNIDEAADKIQQIITDKNLAASLRARGYEQVKKYDWQDCAKKTLDIYNRL